MYSLMCIFKMRSNLIIAYHKKKGFRIIYHVIRFEFKRATPAHVQSIIDRIEGELDKEEKI